MPSPHPLYVPLELHTRFQVQVRRLVIDYPAPLSRTSLFLTEGQKGNTPGKQLPENLVNCVCVIHPGLAFKVKYHAMRYIIPDCFECFLAFLNNSDQGRTDPFSAFAGVGEFQWPDSKAACT